MKEIFKDIPNYEGLYQISNIGRVKSLERKVRNSEKGFRVVKEGILKNGDNGNGYLQIHLCKSKKRKCYKIHQLVAMAFLNHKTGSRRLVVDHVDNNKLNNKVSNLQIISQRFNVSKDRKNCSSKYTGVAWHKKSKKWRSTIRINGKNKWLGHYDKELDASIAYQHALKKIV